MTQTALKLQLTDRQTADFEMIGNGGFAPLTGPQGSDDWRSVVENMTLTSGEYWPIPITLASDLDVAVGDVVSLSSDEGKPLGRLTVEEVYERDVWNHIRDHRIPYNPLHDRGYPSIGCTHCTQPVGPGASSRDGRWVGTSKSECGIN